jgi:hypothetical protein
LLLVARLAGGPPSHRHPQRSNLRNACQLGDGGMNPNVRWVTLSGEDCC